MRHHPWTLPILLTALLLGGALLAACGDGGGDERDEVRRTVQDFVSALDERDEDRLYELLPNESQQQVSKEEIAADFPTLEGIRFRLQRINDEDITLNDARDQAQVNATVTVEVDDVEQDIPTAFLLRKEDGRWRLVPGEEPQQPQDGGAQPTPAEGAATPAG
ncbi:MAG TPA: hypothetical protein VIO14_04625 [Dehalococcoidia bacterium]